MKRIATALVAVPLLLALLLKGPAWLFTLLALICALAAYWEISTLSAKVGFRTLPVGYLLVPLLVLSFYPGFPGLPAMALVSISLVGISAIYSRRPSLETLGAIAMTFLGTIYVGALLGSVVGIRAIDPERGGRLWVIFLLAVVMMGDAGAYYVGSAWGRRPLAPILSPKKTIEGLIGGVVVSVATALALRTLVLHELPLLAALGLGLALALLGVAGDLFESLLKRSAGVKDTSTLIPGHGGVLDRVDSILFAAPVLWLYLTWT